MMTFRNSLYQEHAVRKYGNSKEKTCASVSGAVLAVPFTCGPAGLSSLPPARPQLSRFLIPRNAAQRMLHVEEPPQGSHTGVRASVSESSLGKRDGKIAVRYVLNIHSHLHASVQEKWLVIQREYTAASQFYFLCLPCGAK